MVGKSTQFILQKLSRDERTRILRAVTIPRRGRGPRTERVGGSRARRRPEASLSHGPWVMRVLASAAGLLLRAAETTDVPLLAKWRSDPQILEFYGGRDRPLDENAVRKDYFRRRRDPATGRFFEYRPCIVEVDQAPVAFVQYFRLPIQEAALFGYPSNERTYGLDFFIGDPVLWGKGLGPRVIELARDFLCEMRGASRVVADPRVDNPRSVRALEKARFRKIRVLRARELHEGAPRDCWLVEYP